MVHMKSPQYKSTKNTISSYGFWIFFSFILRFAIYQRPFKTVNCCVHNIKNDKSNLKPAQNTAIAVYSVNRRHNSFSFIPSPRTKSSGDLPKETDFRTIGIGTLFAFKNIHALSCYIIAPANIAQTEFPFHSVNKKHYTNQYTPARSSGLPEMPCG